MTLQWYDYANKYWLYVYLHVIVSNFSEKKYTLMYLQLIRFTNYDVSSWLVVCYWYESCYAMLIHKPIEHVLTEQLTVH